MDFPKRIKQHQAQSNSFAILLYRLRDAGIFRNVTENDYGIDFEIEIVHNDKLVGRYIKAQVKAAEKIKKLKDGTAYTSGIKQSTLLYWAELSYRSHVIVFAVDLETELIYMTDTVFWQATSLLDKTDKSKSIKFRRVVDLSEAYKDKDNKEREKLKFENFILTLLLKKVAFSNSIPDIINAHRTFLRNIKQIFALYADTWHYDPWTEVQELDMFKVFLDCAKTLVSELPEELPEEFKALDDKDRKYIFSSDYWALKTGWGGDEVTNQIAKTPLKLLMPLILKKASYYSECVLNGKYYWRERDQGYLKLVYSVLIPTDYSQNHLTDLGYREHSKQLENPKDFSALLYDS